MALICVCACRSPHQIRALTHKTSFILLPTGGLVNLSVVLSPQPLQVSPWHLLFVLMLPPLHFFHSKIVQLSILTSCQAKENMVPLAVRKYCFLSIQSKKMNLYQWLWLRFGSVTIFFLFFSFFSSCLNPNQSQVIVKMSQLAHRWYDTCAPSR